MDLSKKYLIDEMTVLLGGELDYHGNLCSRVVVGSENFLIHKSPMNIIKESIIYYGSNFHAASSFSKDILSHSYKCPIIVSLQKGLCMFTVKSGRDNHDAIWFMYNHIVKVEPFGRKTKVYFNFGHSMIVDCRYSSFIAKKNQAADLCRTISERSENGITFYVDQKSNKKITKKKDGTYKFAGIGKNEE
ncbi:MULTISPECIES: competence protein ComK [unclassified Bacillus (in: firmicutes)]|uniref:competence protein ComK n=1 Tax=unclassified Bacillus (in: firmicutes) TaxID=185979 RepID=UPI0008EFA4A9|nr:MULTISPECIES: competence protein ComK [unclassified Bacillus (in: firmicutes)]SFA86058.1 competence protein ComK [Bacillus sp. UNCCL13]SFQ83573.1 competence protein ComK [Bacillus sp. cl95]